MNHETRTARTAGSHAVVLGASLAGLLAARVLAEAHERVTVIERDELPRSVADRRGVPQGRHLHGLHPRGAEILEELFPGITAQLVADGAITADMLGNIRWQLSGHQFAQAPSRLQGLLASRPFIEAHVRDRVRAMRQVTMLECCDVMGIEATADRARITGARIHPHGSPAPSTITADLVVDATGRGARTPRWLDELGYPPPTTDRVEIDLGYATRQFRLRPGALGDDQLILTAGTATNPRMGVLAAMEGGRHIVTLGGILGHHPPTDPDGFVRFAGALSFPDIAAALDEAEPLDEGTTFRYPASVRRRYEQLDRFPAGLLVLGDAVCSFNPVYGQGMTVAAAQALTLRHLLAQRPVPDPRRYFRSIARAVDTPWDIAVGADLAFPDVPGERTRQIRLVNAYLPRLHAAATHDATLAQAFVRVLGLLDRPEGLLRPDRVLRVWRTNHGHRRDAASATTGVRSGQSVSATS